MGWMPITPLSDSSHQNRNACLLNQFPDRIVFFDQQADTNTRQLCYRRISPGMGDISIALSQAGVEFTHPKSLNRDYFTDFDVMLYQTNEGSDIDLKYFSFSNYTVSDSKILADLPGDDINLVVGNWGMVAWENNGKIYVSQYISSSGSFTPPFAVDSAGAYSPALSDKLNYLKNNGDSTLVISLSILYDQGTWQISNVSNRTFPGHSSSLVSSPDFFWDNSMCMENKIGTNPTGLILFGNQSSQTQYMNSGIYNYIEPAIHDFKIGVRNGYYFLSYVSDSLGQNEVFTETPWGFIGGQNISQWPGDDRNPEFFESYGETETIRVYLFWESQRQGFSTIYSTYLEYPFGGIGDNPKTESLSVYPCPFGLETSITFKSTGKCPLSIFDFQGRLIRTLLSDYGSEGWQKAVWDGKSNSGSYVPSGSYLVVCQLPASLLSKVIIKE